MVKEKYQYLKNSIVKADPPKRVEFEEIQTTSSRENTEVESYSFLSGLIL